MSLNTLNALITTYNKSNLSSLADYLHLKGYTVYSTGGTYDTLQKLNPNLVLVKVEDLTNFPEILGGRVKSLHPMVYGGILSRRSSNDENDREDYHFPLFDLVVVNLYDFIGASHQNLSEQEMIELIDIGGVSLIRASAKNYNHILILTTPDDYDDYIQQYTSFTPTEQLKYRLKKASKAFQTISEYDLSISRYYQQLAYPESLIQLRYGTNSHQTPAYMIDLDYTGSESNRPFKVLNGSPSYINCLDFIHSWLLVAELRKVFNCHACASFKHTSPAGVALEVSEEFTEDDFLYYDLSPDFALTPQAKTYLKTRNCDPISSFGDFVAFSHPVDLETALLIKREVSDGIVAPSYSPEALEVLKNKKDGSYLILTASYEFFEDYLKNDTKEIKEIYGLHLEQPPNKYITTLDVFNPGNGYVHTKAKTFSMDVRRDLVLANISLKYAQSNNICMAYKGQVIGLAAGQQNRVDSVKISVQKAQKWFLRQHPIVKELKKSFKDNLKRPEKNNIIGQVLEASITIDELNTYLKSPIINIPSQVSLETYLDEHMKDLRLASDAFFPFSDNIELANKYGVKYIIQPGGSTRDENIITTCDKYSIAMLQTGIRMFYH
jgi:phosphoribosylaminoimidazolecarboxamide formyltransferase/IMP cyclohydrolase